MLLPPTLKANLPGGDGRYWAKDMGPDEKMRLDKEADVAGEESFPASDPPPWTLGIDPDEDQAEDSAST
jgi:hypothetical protein